MAAVDGEGNEIGDDSDVEAYDVEGTQQALGNTAFPLLDPKPRRGGSWLWDWCYGKADSVVLPADPRSLVQPGVSNGKAVYFNAFYKDCHTNPAAVGEVGHPKTCGELRTRFYKGEGLLTTGGPKVGSLFAGTDPNALDAGLGISVFTARQFAGVWKSWGGFLTRPSNFDQLVSERYGSPFKSARNPYPLTNELLPLLDEDPNRTNGGSGKLPEMFTQLRDKDGKWTGQIGITCHACHSGQAGTSVTTGGGSSLADLNLFLRDMLPRGYPASLATIINLNHTRGTNNASDINLAFLFPEEGWWTIGELLGLLTSGSTASMDTPAWWNMGHRALKFVDGVFPIDAPRVDMVFYTPFFGLFGRILGPLTDSGQAWMRENGPPLNTWVEALKSPAYPLAVNTTLAQQGAVLFHELDLWSRTNSVPRPAGGNGSCASCHGAYSPRYFNDPAVVSTPMLEGMASYIVPKNIIGTDPARVDTNNEAVQTTGAKNFFGYPQTYGTANDCGPQNQARLRGTRAPGYLAPPLYGVWATAPYFHNGSVPNVWEVLKPADRKTIWRRKSKPAPSGPRVIMGFDTDMARAYDPAKMGWKYDVIACQNRGILNPAVTPYVTCNPNDEYDDTLANQIYAALAGNLILVWNILFPPILTNNQMEDRKIYNTLLYSQGNEGHAFNSVLTDTERTAIIEYLKTL